MVAVSVSTEELYSKAENIAAEFNHGLVGTEHLLCALADDLGCMGNMLRKSGVHPDVVRIKLRELFGLTEPFRMAQLQRTYDEETGKLRPIRKDTKRLQELKRIASNIAEQMGDPFVTKEHVLRAFVQLDSPGNGWKILKSCCDVQILESNIRKIPYSLGL